MNVTEPLGRPLAIKVFLEDRHDLNWDVSPSNGLPERTNGSGLGHESYGAPIPTARVVHCGEIFASKSLPPSTCPAGRVHV